MELRSAPTIKVAIAIPATAPEETEEPWWPVWVGSAVEVDDEEAAKVVFFAVELAMEEVPDARPAPEGLEEVVELAVENVVELVVGNVVELVVEEIPNEDVSEVVVCVVELAVAEISGARPAPEVLGEEVLESDMIEILQHMKIPNKIKYQSSIPRSTRKQRTSSVGMVPCEALP